MGSLGVPEMMFIFILALVLFGPKKLPEIGRTVGNAIKEFRRASSELQSTFTNELQNLERETESIKQATIEPHQDTYNYDYSTYDSQYGETAVAQIEAPAADPSSESASATQGAESPSAEAPEGAIALDAEIVEAPDAGAPSEDAEHSSSALVAESASTPAEHET